MPPKRKAVGKDKEQEAKKRKTQNKRTDKKSKIAKELKADVSTEKKKAKKSASSSKASTGKKSTLVTSLDSAKSSASTSATSVSWLQRLLVDKKWMDVLSQEFEEPYFKELESKLDSELNTGQTMFPPRDLIFNAFNLTPLEKVKVVILGQDPYHDDGQAMGLSFSVPKDVKTPPSLKNIYKELERDPDIKGFMAPDHGCLDKWANDGILLLNATLTVQAHKPNSHAKFGWQTFTDNVIKAISNHGNHVVFILWGGFAQKKEKLVDIEKNEVIKAAHPSPLSVSKFMGCSCFSECNKRLKKLGHSAVDWSL